MPRGQSGTQLCTKCQREFSLFGFKKHSDACKGIVEKKKRVAWNKGLSKETSDIVKQMSESCSKSQRGKVGRRHSDETKMKISESRKRYLENNPDKIPYLLNHSSKISYPEQYFLECFKNTDIVFQHHVFRYKLDFANVNSKIYLEIDGEQHYVDKRVVEHDVVRTSKLEELGWTGYRVRWSEFQKLSDDQKQQKVKELHSLMKSVS